VSESVEVWDGHRAEVGGLAVSRTLPRRDRRTVGPWCFVDHFGPQTATMRVGPHPHIGLHTVTWLLEGEVVHTDSLGSEQPIRPGQLNLMTAGHGIAHAEDGGPIDRPSHGVQLWVAQPSSTRHGAPRFAHHPELPIERLDDAVLTVLTGAVGSSTSPARTDAPSIGVDLVVDGVAEIPLDETYEHALVVVDGTLEIEGRRVAVGQLAYLGTGRATVGVRGDGPARALLLGGAPFEEPIFMWWNFVARDRDEMETAAQEWNEGSDRFGEVAGGLEVIEAPPPHWLA
jgi:quercetin 2,3-dioxygenase